MEFAILGPLGVYEQDRFYAPTAPKQRQLLALLLLNADRVVSTSTCTDELWADNPPNPRCRRCSPTFCNYGTF
jgi:SARP family transcriptional regulator, regulator of embCAB operon